MCTLMVTFHTLCVDVPIVVTYFTSEAVGPDPRRSTKDDVSTKAIPLLPLYIYIITP